MTGLRTALVGIAGGLAILAAGPVQGQGNMGMFYSFRGAANPYYAGGYSRGPLTEYNVNRARRLALRHPPVWTDAGDYRYVVEPPATFPLPPSHGPAWESPGMSKLQWEPGKFLYSSARDRYAERRSRMREISDRDREGVRRYEGMYRSHPDEHSAECEIRRAAEERPLRPGEANRSGRRWLTTATRRHSAE